MSQHQLPNQSVLDESIIELHPGKRFLAANAPAMNRVIRAYGQLELLAESPEPVSPAQLDKVLDTLAEALDHWGIDIRSSVSETAKAIATAAPVLLAGAALS